MHDKMENFIKSAAGKTLAFLFPPAQTDFNPTSVHRILVVRQHDQLGDMICVVPLLRTLKESFPGAHITLVASPVNYAIMNANPYADRVINYNKKQLRSSPTKALGFLEELRLGGYDLAVVPATVSLSLTSDLIAALSGAKYRIGPGSLSGKDNATGSVYNRKVTLDWSDAQHRHQALRNIDILKPLKLRQHDPGDEALQCTLGLTDAERHTGTERVKAMKGENPLIIGLHPGAGKEGNRWPVDRFVHLAQWLITEHNAAIVVTSGPMDDQVLKQFSTLAKFPFHTVERTPIREVAAILNALDLVVSNDTGIMHIAGGLRPPLVSLFGPTDPNQWAPKGHKNRYLAAPVGNISSITECSVRTAITDLLQPQP